MKKLLLITLFNLICLSSSVFATPVDLVSPSSPTEQTVQKENFFDRIFKRRNKKRIRKLNKKLKKETLQCDRIITIDGDEIKVVIVEMNAKRIRYKKCDYENGPTRSIRIQDIFVIKYAGGEKNLFVDIETLRKNQVSANMIGSNRKSKSIRGTGIGLGLILGLFGLIVVALAFDGEERGIAVRGALGGMLIRLLIILTILLLFVPFL